MGKLRNPFRSAYTENKLVDADEVTCDKLAFNFLGRETVPAGTAVSIGYADLTGQQSAEGRLYMDLKDDADADINGMVRMLLHDPQDRPVETLWEGRTEQLRTSKSDRRQQLPMAKHDAVAGQDWSIVLQFKPDEDGKVSKTNSTIFLDITNFTVR